VSSVSPASGSVFSLLPPDNATGNFTKIVQRLPVRIRLPADVTAERQLRPGMSVVVSVNTKQTATAATNTALSFAAQAMGREQVR
jgi:membrane fusion protein (multidrug efflux system)